jgi:DNA-binding PadR family transcriptional regulator
VLSVVIERPGHGYDIGTRAASRYQGLYRLTVQHVYGNLRRLRTEGLIEPMDVDLEGRPLSRRHGPKTTYRATADGARGFRDWLAGPIAPDVARRELFPRLRALRPDDYRSMLRLLDRYEEAVLGSIGYVSARTPLTIVDELAREDHEASIEGQLRWSDGAREKLLARIAREHDG